MKRFIWLISFSFAVISSSGQEISRQDADSMLRTLDKGRSTIDRIDLLLHLAQFHIFKPGENQIDFDSATVYLNEAAALTKSVKSPSAIGYQLLTESYLLKEKGQKDESKKMVERAIELLRSGSNKSYLGSAYYELSGYYNYWNSEELRQKISLVKKSLEAFQEAGDRKNIARGLEMLGDLYIRQEAYADGIKVLNQTLAAYETIKYPKVQGVYALLGEAYYHLRDFGNALIQIQKALKTAREVNDTSMRLCQLNNMMGSLYSEINRKEESLIYKKEALKTAMKFHDEPAILMMAVTISVTNIHLNQPGEALKVLASIPKTCLANIDTSRIAWVRMAYLRTYLALQQYDKAELVADSTLALLNSRALDYNIRLAIHRLVANLYFNKKQYSKARYYLTKNLRILEQVNYEGGKIEDSKVWYKIDSAEGDFKSAFNHFAFLKSKTDSILSETRVRQLQVLGVEYETEMKEDSIKLKDQDIALLTQKSSLQEANLRQASLIKNVTFAGIILAFLIAGLLYRQSQQRQRTNKIITHQNEQLHHFLNEKEWLLKEIHHRVKNNLQIVMSLLNSQSAYIDNPYALTAIHDSQHRVHAMSLIHQKLYGSDNVSSIDMSVYIREMVAYLGDSFDVGRRIRFELNIDETKLDVSQAVPIGLILNEAITNAIKYAFPDERSGVISISFSTTTSRYYLLRISDNGVGLPSEIHNTKTGSLGMSLMQGLSEDLNGKFSLENDDGTVIKISFADNGSVNRPHTPSFVSSTQTN